MVIRVLCIFLGEYLFISVIILGIILLMFSLVIKWYILNLVILDVKVLMKVKLLNSVI